MARARNRSPERLAWANMIARCYRPSTTRFYNYGGRGITVCDRWLSSFESFLADMGPRPSPGHSVDRVNPDGNYEPGNCRWATATEQARNRRCNRMVTARGRTMCVSAWSEETGVPIMTLHNRLNAGVDPDRAVGPESLYPPVIFRGEEMSLAQVASCEGIPINSLRRRLKQHGDIEAAIEAWKRNRDRKAA